MPCDKKVHIVEEKWRRKREREQEAERRRKQQPAAIPAPDWPVKKPAEAPQ